MTSSIKGIAVVAALAALALVAMFLLGRDEAEPAPRREALHAQSASPPPAIAIEAPPVAPARVEREVTPPPAERSATAAAPVAAVRKRERVLLNGEIVGIVREYPWIAPLQMVTPRSMTADVDARGRFQLDITALMDQAADYETLELLADDPSYLPARSKVRLVDQRGAALTADRLPFVRIAVTVARRGPGLVVDERGKGVPGALIGVFERGRDGPSPAPFTTTVSDAGGQFDLRLDLGRLTYVIVAINTDPGLVLRPVAAEMRWECPTLVMPAGVCIGGQVRRSGVEPIAGAVVQATRADCLESLRSPAPRIETRRSRVPDRNGRPVFLTLGKHELLWRKGEVELATTVVTTGDEGCYCIGGLAPTDYQISVRELPGLDLHPALTEKLARMAAAPSNRVDLDVSYGVIAIRVSNRIGPLEGMMVRLDAEGLPCTRFTGADGSIELATPPDIRIPFVVGRNARAAYQDVILTPGNDQHVTRDVRLR